jgi:hypothetical protein
MSIRRPSRLQCQLDAKRVRVISLRIPAELAAVCCSETLSKSFARRKLGSRPRARQGETPAVSTTAQCQTASLADIDAQGGLPGALCGWSFFGTEGDRKRTGGHGQGCCTSRLA